MQTVAQLYDMLIHVNSAPNSLDHKKTHWTCSWCLLVAQERALHDDSTVVATALQAVIRQAAKGLGRVTKGLRSSGVTVKEHSGVAGQGNDSSIG